jgi:hypothetical protein
VCLLRGTFYILRSAHTVYLCVLCGSEKKQRLFPCTTLSDFSIIEKESVYCAVRAEYLNIYLVILSLQRVDMNYVSTLQTIVFHIQRNAKVMRYFDAR